MRNLRRNLHVITRKLRQYLCTKSA